MKKALFIILPYPSHYNACLGVMQARQQEGYQVFATVIPSLTKHVTELGINPVELPLIDIPFMFEKQILSLQTWLALWIQSHINRNFVQKRYRNFILCVQMAEKVVADIKPSYIYIDSALSHYFFVLHQYQSQIILLNTRLSTRQIRGIPPYNSARVAQNDSLSKINSAFEWGRYRIKAEIRRRLRSLALGKLSDQAMLSRINRKRGIKEPICWHRANMNYPLPIGPVEWILCPQVFEYPWIRAASTEQYVWYVSKKLDSELSKPLADWLATTKSGERIVYCSLGTLSSHTPEITISFLRRVIRAISKLPSVKLIVATGTLLDPLLVSNSQSIFLTDYLPQTALLPYCDVMITHGGMNTVKECICAGVPMLVFPLNAHVEQPGNAARVLYHGLGLAGDITRESEASIQQKLMLVLQTSGFKERVLSMRKNFQN